MKTKEDVENQQRSNEERWPSAKSSYFPTPTPPTEKCCEMCREEVPGGRFMYFCAKDNDCPCHTTDKGWEKEFEDKWYESFDHDGAKEPRRFQELKDFIRHEREEEYARGKKDAVEFLTHAGTLDVPKDIWLIRRKDMNRAALETPS